ncbi:MAG: methyltransferase domain-containing protein [Phycisphaeraceae bacterium]
MTLPRVLETEVMDTVDEAESYAAMDHTEGNAAFVERVVQLGGERIGEAEGWVLDLGTGPGDIPLMLCERIKGLKVLGVDASWEMLRLAQQRRHAAPPSLAKRMLFQLADVKALPLLAGNFDAVICNTILHHIPEPQQLLREAARVLRPGGLLLIRDLFRPESQERLQELVDLHAAENTPHQRQMFRDSLHAALTPDELRTLADANGLRHAEIVIDSDRHMSLQMPCPA